MPFDHEARLHILSSVANDYLSVIDANIQREYPHMPWMVVNDPGRLPSHRELHPVFFGYFDWHSCVEMWWAAIRLMRRLPNLDTEPRVRMTMEKLLTTPAINVERAFFDAPAHAGFERPYGWGWLLTLQHELDEWVDPDGQRWAATLRPLSSLLVERMTTWLPKLTYPQRFGLHSNTAFALLRSLDLAGSLASAGDPALRDAIEAAALRFYGHDRDYPAHYEPGGADFLSGALTEAELMAQVLPGPQFVDWFNQFLQGLARSKPSPLLEPAIVSDPTDGQIAHLSGLNLSRAAGFIAISRALPADDPRKSTLIQAAERHAAASLGSVAGSHYMEEHWLAAYATLLLTA
jgi:hypothetical protein